MHKADSLTPYPVLTIHRLIYKPEIWPVNYSLFANITSYNNKTKLDRNEKYIYSFKLPTICYFQRDKGIWYKHKYST